MLSVNERAGAQLSGIDTLGAIHRLDPAVLEAAAVGIPDAHYGQEILACVVLKTGASCDERITALHGGFGERAVVDGE